MRRRDEPGGRVWDRQGVTGLPTRPRLFSSRPNPEMMRVPYWSAIMSSMSGPHCHAGRITRPQQSGPAVGPAAALGAPVWFRPMTRLTYRTPPRGLAYAQHSSNNPFLARSGVRAGGGTTTKCAQTVGCFPYEDQMCKNGNAKFYCRYNRNFGCYWYPAESEEAQRLLDCPSGLKSDEYPKTIPEPTLPPKPKPKPTLVMQPSMTPKSSTNTPSSTPKSSTSQSENAE
jgi:hypothetical protein